MKPRKENVRPYHLSRTMSGEKGGSLDDNLSDSYLFRVIMVDE